MLKSKCAVCGITKIPISAGKLTGPSLAEGEGIVGTAAMTVGDMLIEHGIPFLAKKGVEAGR